MQHNFPHAFDRLPPPAPSSSSSSSFPPPPPLYSRPPHPSSQPLSGQAPPPPSSSNNSNSNNVAVTIPPSSSLLVSKHVILNYCKSNEIYVGVRFIQDCGRKLGLESLTVCTAVGLFHGFFRAARRETDVPGTSGTVYDQYLIAAACLYLSGKLEESQQLRVRDVINVVHATLRPDQAEQPLSLESEYYSMREAICQAELLVLRMVRFQTKFDHPHRYLLHYLKSVKEWISPDVWQKYPIARTSWALMQDFYHDPRVLDTDSSHAGVACIAIALETYGIQIPFVSENTSWINAFSQSLTKERLWEIMVLIMEVHANDSIYINPLKMELPSSSSAVGQISF